jgi:hypothetical protein
VSKDVAAPIRISGQRLVEMRGMGGQREETWPVKQISMGSSYNNCTAYQQKHGRCEQHPCVLGLAVRERGLLQQSTVPHAVQLSAHGAVRGDETLQEEHVEDKINTEGSKVEEISDSSPWLKMC